MPKRKHSKKEDETIHHEEQRFLLYDSFFNAFSLRTMSKRYYWAYRYDNKWKMRDDRPHVSAVHLYIEAHVLGLPSTGQRSFKNDMTRSGKETMANLVNQKAYMKPLLIDKHDYYTPLQLAVIYDIPHLVEFFLSCSEADINIKDSDGRDVVQLALIYGVTSIQRGSTLYQLLHSRMFDVHSRCNRQYSTLHYCFFDHRHDCRNAALELINNYGADIEAKEITGKTPLHIAVYMNNLPQIRFLIDILHARTDCVCDEGWTLLHSVCANPDHLAQNPSEIYALPKLRYLLYERGFISFVYTKDKEGVTPLHLACFASMKSENVECISELIKCGARYDVLDCDGNTPLYDVVSSGNTVAARTLFAHIVAEGGNVNDEISRCNKWGRNAIHMACFHGQNAMLRVFHQYQCQSQ